MLLRLHAERLGKLIKSQEKIGEFGLFEARAETSVGVKEGKLLALRAKSLTSSSLFCQLQFSPHTSSPTATIRQLQSVAAGSSLEFTIK